jgi:hypothetical protein
MPPIKAIAKAAGSKAVPKLSASQFLKSYLAQKGSSTKVLASKPGLTHLKSSPLRKAVAAAQIRRMADMSTGRMSTYKQVQIKKMEDKRRQVLQQVAEAKRLQAAEKRKRIEANIDRLKKEAASLIPAPAGSVTVNELGEDIWNRILPQLIITPTEAVAKLNGRKLSQPQIQPTVDPAKQPLRLSSSASPSISVVNTVAMQALQPKSSGDSAGKN